MPPRAGNLSRDVHVPQQHLLPSLSAAVRLRLWETRASSLLTPHDEDSLMGPKVA